MEAVSPMHSSIERPSRELAKPTPQMPELALPGTRYTIGRLSDNELVLFDESARESWIVYPPRSAYDFLSDRRPTASTVVVEHHPWAPYARVVDHRLDSRNACDQHGTDCPANQVIQAAVDLGFNPFA